MNGEALLFVTVCCVVSPRRCGMRRIVGASVSARGTVPPDATLTSTHAGEESYVSTVFMKQAHVSSAKGKQN